MNIDAKTTQAYGRTWQNEGRNHKLTSKFHFSLTDEGMSKRRSDNPLEKGVTENIWKMYNKARELLPYKERMENLTWRMMYVNNYKDYRRSVERSKRSGGDVESSFSSSEFTSSSFSPAFDELDYKSQVQKMAEDANNYNDNLNDVRKRPAEFSPLMNNVKPHSNLSASLAAIKNGLIDLHFGSDGSFSFQLEQMAFEGPASNFSESFRSNTRSQTPTLHVDTGNNTPQSHLTQIDIKGANDIHPGSYMDSNYSSTSPLTTIGPSAILNGYNQSQLGTQNSSLVSLADHFRSQNTTPFTNQLSTQNMANLDNSGNPPYPLVHSNSFSIRQSPDINNSKVLSQKTDAQFDGYDYSTSATSTSNYFDSFNKNYMQVTPNSFTPNKRANAYDNFSSSLPAFLNETFATEMKKSNKKSRISSKKKQNKVLSPDFNLPMSKREDLGSISCTNCNTKATPLWRRDPQGKPLCNACGLFLKLHGVVRPLSLKTDVIKKRQRGSSKKSVSGSKGGDGDDLNPTPMAKDTKPKTATSDSNANTDTSPSRKRLSSSKNTNNGCEKVGEPNSISNTESNHADSKLNPIHEIDSESAYFDHSAHHFSPSNIQLPSKTEESKNDWDWLGMS